MKFKTSSTFKRLTNAVGKVSSLKPYTRTRPVDALKLPSYYDKYSNVALYSGDWMNIKCDCIHFGDEATLQRELVLARIAKHDAMPSLEDDCTNNVDGNHNQGCAVMKVTNYIPHINYVSHGELDEVERKLLQHQQRSLVIPFDVFNSTNYGFIEALAEQSKSLRKLEKVVLCVSDDNTWSVLNKLFKS